MNRSQKKMWGAWVIAQLVKCLLWMHEDLSSSLRTHVENSTIW